MNILFNDVLQQSDAPRELISSSLADVYTFTGTSKTIEIELQEPSSINSIGVGNYHSIEIELYLYNSSHVLISHFPVYKQQFINGLYLLDKEVPDVKFVDILIYQPGVGRIALGRAINLKTSIPKEPALVSTNTPRVTLSGQVIEGLGGYNYWRVSLDTRYKIDNDKMNEIIKGFPSLSKGLPLFISFEEEKDRLPFERLYVNDTKQQELSFESSINKPLFSRRWNFEERF